MTGGHRCRTTSASGAGHGADDWVAYDPVRLRWSSRPATAGPTRAADRICCPRSWSRQPASRCSTTPARSCSARWASPPSRPPSRAIVATDYTAYQAMDRGSAGSSIRQGLSIGAFSIRITADRHAPSSASCTSTEGEWQGAAGGAGGLGGGIDDAISSTPARPPASGTATNGGCGTADGRQIIRGHGVCRPADRGRPRSGTGRRRVLPATDRARSTPEDLAQMVGKHPDPGTHRLSALCGDPGQDEESSGTLIPGEISSIIVMSGGAPSRAIGPQKPAPLVM